MIKISVQLRIFAHHVQQIASQVAPTEFTLHTCENGASYHVKIEKNVAGNSPEKDRVYIDGTYHGNRNGAVQAFARLIHAEEPTLNQDDDHPITFDRRMS